ncbi:MAG: cystathionine beta-lyase [Parasphingorhabdus sp.]|jgi:cystathionine beta-lyase
MIQNQFIREKLLKSSQTDIRLFDEVINRREVPALKVHPMVLGQHGENLFGGSVADMDFKAPQVVLNAMQKRLKHGVFGYETVPEELLPALTNWLKSRHGFEVDQSHILRAPNVLNILAFAATLFCKPNDAIIIQPPVFFDFFDVIEENHRQVITNPLKLVNGRYLMDFDDLEQKAARPDATMLYLCNPHNPVGRVWTRVELTTLAEICLRHNVLVVADEMHGDLVFNNKPYIPFASLGGNHAANSITCLSPGKTFNIAACSCAFTLISDTEKRVAFQTENSRITANKNNAFANVAMVAAYNKGEPWLKAALTYIEQNLQLLRTRLTDITGVELIEPEGTFLAWLDFRGLQLETDELNSFLKDQAKWVVSKGPAFGQEGTGFARVNIACRQTIMDNALSNLHLAVKSRSA